MTSVLICEEYVKTTGLKCECKVKSTNSDGKKVCGRHSKYEGKKETKCEIRGESLMDYINSDLSPLSVSDNPWLYENSGIISYDTGKWMLFYPIGLMNEKWLLAKKLYREKKLYGINSMKCSTLFQNPRASDLNNGIIIIYSSDSSNEEKIRDIGKKILDSFNYTEQQMIYYKTDLQTDEGTIATGSRKNHTYQLFNHLYKHKRLL